MAKLFTLGSINLDLFFNVPHLVQPGETLTATSTSEALGGKGINQSIAAAKAGAEVIHIGAMGQNTPTLLHDIARFGVATDHITVLDTYATGTAVIAVDAQGENAIMLAPGANRAIPEDWIINALALAAEGDWLVLQNETNGAELAVAEAQKRGMKIALSAAPFEAAQVEALIYHVDLIAVNADEARGIETHLGIDLHSFEGPAFLVTKGKDGAEYIRHGNVIAQPAFPVTPVDTTGAGDTFCGTFLASLTQVQSIPDALTRAAAAAALQVTQPGAAPAIPDAASVTAFIESNR